MKKVYVVVLVTRAKHCPDPEVDILVFDTIDKARKALNDEIDHEIEKRDLDLTDPSNDGILYMDGDDHFAFYDYVGGDWYFTGSIYERDVM